MKITVWFEGFETDVNTLYWRHNLMKIKPARVGAMLWARANQESPTVLLHLGRPPNCWREIKTVPILQDSVKRVLRG